MPKRRRGSGSPVPFVAQMSATDCGVAALAMVLIYHGYTGTLEDLRRLVPTSPSGTTAASLLRAARHLGLIGRGVSLEPDYISHLPPATILHWESRHFVVFVRADSRWVEVLDPCSGRRLVHRKAFRASFSKVALVFGPLNKSRPRPATRSDRHERLRDRRQLDPSKKH